MPNSAIRAAASGVTSIAMVIGESCFHLWTERIYMKCLSTPDLNNKVVHCVGLLLHLGKLTLSLSQDAKHASLWSHPFPTSTHLAQCLSARCPVSSSRPKYFIWQAFQCSIRQTRHSGRRV